WKYAQLVGPPISARSPTQAPPRKPTATRTSDVVATEVVPPGPLDRAAGRIRRWAASRLLAWLATLSAQPETTTFTDTSDAEPRFVGVAGVKPRKATAE